MVNKTMGDDFYCYQPTSSIPSAKEARAVIDSEEGEIRRDDEEAREMKLKVVAALVEYNPRLQPFKRDYGEIAKFMKISEEQARTQWSHVELNAPEGDLAIQVEVYGDHVGFTIPYWYTGAKADQVFEQLDAYLQVIHKACGYFAYDPQTAKAFDPEKERIEDHEEYNRIARNLPSIIAQGGIKIRKPWWKFW
jgi:hypothetical protein